MVSFLGLYNRETNPVDKKKAQAQRIVKAARAKAAQLKASYGEGDHGSSDYERAHHAKLKSIGERDPERKKKLEAVSRQHKSLSYYKGFAANRRHKYERWADDIEKGETTLLPKFGRAEEANRKEKEMVARLLKDAKKRERQRRAAKRNPSRAKK